METSSAACADKPCQRGALWTQLDFAIANSRPVQGKSALSEATTVNERFLEDLQQIFQNNVLGSIFCSAKKAHKIFSYVPFFGTFSNVPFFFCSIL